MGHKCWSCCGLGLVILLSTMVQGQEEKRYLGKTAKEWVKIVKDKDSPQRMDGVEAMLGVGVLMAMDVGTEEVLGALVSALKDKRELVRARAARGVGNFGADARTAVPALIEALKASAKIKKEDEVFVRVHLLDAVGQIGPAAKAAVPVVLEGLKADDQLVRKQAAESLKKIDPEAAKKAGLK